MARFFFHIRDGRNLIEDRVGLELPSVTSAYSEAQASAREMIAENIKYGDKLDHRRYEVWDEAGTPHFILDFKSVIEK